MADDAMDVGASSGLGSSGSASDAGARRAATENAATAQGSSTPRSVERAARNDEGQKAIVKTAGDRVTSRAT
jgi:hypothetical protein